MNRGSSSRDVLSNTLRHPAPPFRCPLPEREQVKDNPEAKHEDHNATWKHRRIQVPPLARVKGPLAKPTGMYVDGSLRMSTLNVARTHC